MYFASNVTVSTSTESERLWKGWQLNQAANGLRASFVFQQDKGSYTKNPGTYGELNVSSTGDFIYRQHSFDSDGCQEARSDGCLYVAYLRPKCFMFTG